MKTRLLKPVPLTAAAFAPYGDVIECSDEKEQFSINYGNTVKYANLARVDVLAEGGTTGVSIFRSTPVPRPIEIKIMERHPLSSQAFYPLSGRPYMVVVAEKGAFDPEKIKVFLARADQGVNYHTGTWHHFSLALDEVSNFLVIDRSGKGKNCDEVTVENTRIDY
jgi:ureidoglycolate lyase